MSDENQIAERLTEEQAIARIKVLVKESALAKIEIGELLIKYIENVQHNDKKQWYKDNLDMSERTAQYYMQIARNEDVQRLKAEGKLDGLNMTEILRLVNKRVNTRGVNNANAPEQEYQALGYERFDPKKCQSTKKFRKEYKALKDEVTKLEAELAELRSKAS